MSDMWDFKTKNFCSNIIELNSFINQKSEGRVICESCISRILLKIVKKSCDVGL